MGTVAVETRRWTLRVISLVKSDGDCAAGGRGLLLGSASLNELLARVRALRWCGPAERTVQASDTHHNRRFPTSIPHIKSSVPHINSQSFTSDREGHAGAQLGR